jgi:hypothetical protein
MSKSAHVERPTKRTEYEIVFATSQAQRGWTNLMATTRNALADAWDFLTRTPQSPSPTCHRLKGSLASVTHGGTTHERWQYELPGGARLWYYVTKDGRGGVVHLIETHTHHPNATK